MDPFVLIDYLRTLPELKDRDKNKLSGFHHAKTYVFKVVLHFYGQFELIQITNAVNNFYNLTKEEKRTINNTIFTVNTWINIVKANNIEAEWL